MLAIRFTGKILAQCKPYINDSGKCSQREDGRILVAIGWGMCRSMLASIVACDVGSDVV